MRISLFILFLFSCLLLALGEDAGTTSVAEETSTGEAAAECSVDNDVVAADSSEGASTDAGGGSPEQAKDDGNEDASTGDETEKVAEGASADAGGGSPEQAKDAGGEDVSTGGETQKVAEPPVQSGPLVDLLGDTLLSLEMIDEGHAQLHVNYTNECLSGKKVIGLYFSADWCGPCRQFTPDLVTFYNKMNSRRNKENQFEIVWISRCRDFEAFGQYFTHMNWLAMQPEDAMGQRGQMLSDKYKVKGIPSLVLLDEVGNVITTDARNKIPMDKAGIGFPWRNPLATAWVSIVPKSLRLMLKTQVDILKDTIFRKLKGAVGKKARA